jgi:hypothetical protein
VEAMMGVSEEVAGEMGKRLAISEYTLDIDATVIERRKRRRSGPTRR